MVSLLVVIVHFAAALDATLDNNIMSAVGHRVDCRYWRWFMGLWEGGCDLIIPLLSSSQLQLSLHYALPFSTSRNRNVNCWLLIYSFDFGKKNFFFALIPLLHSAHCSFVLLAMKFKMVLSAVHCADHWMITVECMVRCLLLAPLLK
jgi:hypothetical protein